MYRRCFYIQSYKVHKTPLNYTFKGNTNLAYKKSHLFRWLNLSTKHPANSVSPSAAVADGLCQGHRHRGHGRSILEFEGVDTIRVPSPPLILIPTTAGTSADVSQFVIISNQQERMKFSIVSKAVVPDVS